MSTESRILRRAFTRGMAQAFDLTGAIASRRLARFLHRAGSGSVLRPDLRAMRRDLVAAPRVGWPIHGHRRDPAS